MSLAARFKELVDAGRPDDAWSIAHPFWLRTHHPAVGDALSALHLPFTPPSARTRDEMQAAWVGVARLGPQPGAVGWLLAHLTDRLPVTSWRTHGAFTDRNLALLERLRFLEGLPDDPRITDALCALLERPSFTQLPTEGDTERVLRPVVRRLTLNADPRATARLRSLVERPRARQAGTRTWITAACSAWQDPPFEPVDDEPIWRSLAPSAPAEAPPDPVALLRAVYEAPDDDGARAVLADALVELGDARGEFIALQLNGSEEAERAASKLFRAHKDEWLGADLAPVLVNVVFKRGFLHSAELGHNARAEADVWHAAALDPRLATLVRLTKGRGNTEHYASFVTSPNATALLEVEVPGTAVLEALKKATNARIQTLVFPNRPTLATLKAVRSSPALAAVRGLACTVPTDKLAGLWIDLRKSGMLERLTSLRVEQKFTMGAFALPPALLERLAGQGVAVDATRVGPIDAASVFGPGLEAGFTHLALGPRDQPLELRDSPDGRKVRAVGFMVGRVLELVPYLDARSQVLIDGRLAYLPEGSLEPLAEALRQAVPGVTVDVLMR